MLSMTGYGRGSAPLGAASTVIEARAVNHRFLEVRVRLPPQLGDHAGVVEDIARKLLERGRVELSGRIEGFLESEAKLDRERAGAAFRELCALRDELGVNEPVPLSLLAVVPGLFRQDAPDPEALRDALRVSATLACEALQEMRRTEGDALSRDLAGRNRRIRELAAQILGRTGGLRDAHRERLRTRLASLLEGVAAPIDASRLEHEVALLVDRSDIAEELTRLDSHGAQLEALLGRGREAVGRRIEFLLQEMGREVNTIGSKVGDLGVTAHVLELKAELERLREQAQNVL